MPRPSRKNGVYFHPVPPGYHPDDHAYFLFSFWVNNFGTYNKVYGSIGTILILMIVIYFNALILLIGFELNVSIHSLRKGKEREKT